MTTAVSALGPALSEIAVEEMGDLAGFELLRESWDRLVVEAEGSIFQTWEWAFAAWKHFGGGRRLRILAAYSDGKLVGIGPLTAQPVGG